jgi:tripartite-type tricarboxylate transporter receptor subunit TctC
MVAVRCRLGRMMLGLSFLLAGLSPAGAQAPLASYAGKTITVTIGFGPGGSYDFYGHLVARHLGRFLPGRPTMVAENMPGAGSFKAANYLFNVAPKDGTALGIVTQTLALEEALGSPGVMYHAADFTWIGRATSIVEIEVAWHTAKVKAMADTLRLETPVAGTGSGSPSEGYPKLLNAVAGTKFKVITGYTSSTDALLAVERGEVDGASTSWNTVKREKRDWLAEKKIAILVQYTLERSPDLPDVPAVVELGRTPEDKETLAFYTSSAEVGRSFLAPPGLPPERTRMLRDGFDQMLKDPAFLADIEKTGVELNPASGAELEALIKKTASAPKAIIERTRKALEAGK